MTGQVFGDVALRFDPCTIAMVRDRRLLDRRKAGARLLVRAAALGMLCLFVLGSPAGAQQTLDAAIDTQLDIDCNILKGADGSVALDFFGPQLRKICGAAGPSSGGGSSAGGIAGTTQTVPVIISQRLGALREKKGEEEGVLFAGLGASDVAAADASVDFPSGLSLFIASDYEDRDRGQTTFGAGYDSHAWGVTAGADYRFADWLVAGLAFNYNHWNGDLKVGGDFAVDSYGPIAYASVFPLPGAFAQAVLAYARNDYDSTRIAEFDFANPPDGVAEGLNSADYNGDEFSATVLAGYDHAFGQFTLGPRLGLSYLYSGYDSFEETSSALATNPSADIVQGGPTGLELAFDDDSRTSLQSILGVNATAAFQAEGAVIVPQLFLNWHHQFSDDRRSIVVHFAQDNRAPDPQRFSFSTESPDRNFYNLGGAVSVLFDNGLQPYVAAQTLLGHRYYDATSVFVGLRMSLN